MNEEKSSPLPLYSIRRHLPFEQSIQARARVKTENDKGSLKPPFQLAKGRWYDRHRQHVTCAVYLLFVLVLFASCPRDAQRDTFLDKGALQARSMLTLFTARDQKYLYLMEAGGSGRMLSS